MVNFEERVRGCLLGAAIGAELGFSRQVRPERFHIEKPEKVFDVTLEPVRDFQAPRGRMDVGNFTPFIAAGIAAYLTHSGRVTPEDFAETIQCAPALAQPVFHWDGVHSVQELLNEGMNPRLSGLGQAPCGHMAAAMLGTGIYHFGDPEYAYLDGVELASVAQCRLGADWAALAAAAVAAALDSDATGDSVVDTVMKCAFRADKDIFHRMNRRNLDAQWRLAHLPEDQFVSWWLQVGGCPDSSKEQNWLAYNPILFVLPLLARYADAPRKLMPLILAPGSTAAPISCILAGALAGALRGPDVFPAAWIEWALPVALPWFGIKDVVEERLETEKKALQVMDRLTQQGEQGESPLFEKIHGCLLAAGIGNAMGSPVEGRFYWEIDEKYPQGITTVLEPWRLEGEDDNQMAMLLVETYLAREGLPVMARHFGKTWLDRLNRDHFYANCMGNSYDLLCKGWDPRISGHWNVVTGSTVMCMEPVGLYHLADPDYAAVDATAISYMYQRGLDVTAAAILAAAVAEAMRPDAGVDSVCSAALDASPSAPMKTFDERDFTSPKEYIATCLEIADKYSDVLAVRKELYDKCLLYHMIDPLELLGFSFAMFKIARGDVRQAAIGGASIGRDADTIAGRAAMLSGTLSGAKSVPADWISLFKPEVLARIRRNAAALTDLIGDKKTARMRGRLKAAAGFV